MRIRRFDMEDWLNDNARVELNLGESGCEDFHLGELLELCGASSRDLEPLWLGNNDTRGSTRLRARIAECYEQAGDSELMVANGTSEALFTFFNDLLDAGDEVVVPVPAFQCLFEIPEAIGCRVTRLDLLSHSGWRLDLDRLADAVTDATRLIVINNPHNPLGWTLDENELRCIGEIAHAHDAHLLFDEHYRYLPLQPGTGLVPSGYDACKPFHEKTYATGAMIKCFGIVGIRIGWLIADEARIARCRDYKDYLSHTIPLVTDFIAALSLEHRDKLIETKKRDILPNLEALDAFMARQAEHFEYVPPTGGVVCFPRLKSTTDVPGFCQRLIDEQGVSLLPGFAFGVDDHLRLNFGINREKFAEALRRIGVVLG